MKYVTWMLVNGGMAVCAFYGLFQGYHWAENILLFCVWAATILMTVASYSEKTKLALREKGPSVPIWMSHAIDLLLMLAFASVGRFFSAAAMLWQICVAANVYQGKEKPAL